MYKMGQHSFIVLIYVILGQPGKCTDTKVQIGVPFNKNVDLRSAVHRAFLSGTFPKTTTFMATFLGQPFRHIGRLVIYFHGAI
jgi:hypothetical protein